MMDPDRKAFYEYHSSLMEPWDGPASIAFTDGTVIGAVLDRNGLRPSRYYVTKDDLVIMASEVGVLDLPAEDVLVKERLHPGRIFLVDTAKGRIVDDDEIKRELAAQHPYREWLDRNLVDINDLPPARAASRAGLVSTSTTGAEAKRLPILAIAVNSTELPWGGAIHSTSPICSASSGERAASTANCRSRRRYPYSRCSRSSTSSASFSSLKKTAA